MCNLIHIQYNFPQEYRKESVIWFCASFQCKKFQQVLAYLSQLVVYYPNSKASVSSVQARSTNLEFQRTGLGINSPTPEIFLSLYCIVTFDACLVIN